MRELNVPVCHLPNPLSLEEIAGYLPGTEGYILGGPEYLNRDFLKQAQDLRIVAVMGVGTPSFIDLEAATQLGLEVCNTPGANSSSVAEFAVSMIAAVTADIFQSASGVQSGEFWLQTPRKSLQDLHVGILGLGNIGARAARILRNGYETRVSYNSRRRKPDLEEELGIDYLDFTELVVRQQRAKRRSAQSFTPLP